MSKRSGFPVEEKTPKGPIKTHQEVEGFEFSDGFEFRVQYNK